MPTFDQSDGKAFYIGQDFDSIAIIEELSAKESLSRARPPEMNFFNYNFRETKMEDAPTYL